jgi:hypothetical protein
VPAERFLGEAVAQVFWAALLICSTAFVPLVVAQEDVPLIPPKRFDHRFKGKLVEHPGKERQVRMWCATMYGQPFPFSPRMCAPDGQPLRDCLYVPGGTPARDGSL